MKLKYFLLFIFFLLLFNCTIPKGGGSNGSGSNSNKDPLPESIFIKRLGGTHGDYGYSIASDTSNNIIVAGHVIGNADLNGDGDSTDGGAEDATGHGGGDIFISKFNSSGTFQWAKRLGGTYSYEVYSITTDTLNDIYITGKVAGNADLNGDGSISTTFPETAAAINGDNDIFISKFNSDGAFLWTKRLGGTDDDCGYGITVDTHNYIYVTGIVEGNADLGGDGGISPHFPETVTAPFDGCDIFICKIDRFGSSVHWVKRLGGIGDDYGFGITTDTNNKVYVIGLVEGNGDLNGDGSISGSSPDTAGVAHGNSDAFFSVFDSDGTYSWTRRLGGAYNDEGRSIATDTSNNIIITGMIWHDADLNGDGDSTDGGAESAAGFHLSSIFISKFNSSGTFQWAKRLGGLGEDVGYSITTDTSNNIIVTGIVDGAADLNGDGDLIDSVAETGTGIGYGLFDIFISTFDSAGTFSRAGRLGGINDDFGYSITTDTSNNIIVSGIVIGDADLNSDGDSTDGGAENAAGYGGNDIFISKFPD